jgi:phosphohistidine phosphatase
VELCLLRHAHAGNALTWTGDDDLRPLTEKGRGQAERLGRLLLAAGFVPDAVITSPLVRARETAEIVADLVGVASRIDQRLGRLTSFADLEGLLADAGGPVRPLLVGHDPDFSELLSALVGAPIPMRKAQLARIDVTLPFERGAGELRWLVPPDLLPA